MLVSLLWYDTALQFCKIRTIRGTWVKGTWDFLYCFLQLHVNLQSQNEKFHFKKFFVLTYKQSLDWNIIEAECKFF